MVPFFDAGIPPAKGNGAEAACAPAPIFGLNPDADSVYLKP
jgi:hypothetical protein